MKRLHHQTLTLCAAALLAVAGAATPSRAAPPSTQTTEGKAAAIAQPAIAYLEMHWNAYVYMSSPDADFGMYNAQWATRCSGFFVNPTGYVATAGHCVDDGVSGAKDEAIWQAALQLQVDYGLSDEELGQWYNTGKYYWRVEGELAGSNPDRAVYVQHGIALGGKTTGEAWQARVIEVRDIDNGDVALLKVETSDMPILTMAKDVNIDIGTTVLSIGYAGATDEVTDVTYDPSFKDGKINQKTTRGNGALPVYQTSASLSGGMSGGPTVDQNGDVVGVNSFTIGGETGEFDYIMPSSLVQELLSRNGVDNTLPTTDTVYREAVDAYYSGDYETAVAKFDTVLQQVPSHQQAQELRKQSADKLASQPTTPTTTIPPTTVVTPSTVVSQPMVTPTTVVSPTTAAPATDAKGDDGGISTTVIIAIAAAAVLLLGGGLWFGLRRRRNRPPTQPTTTPTWAQTPPPVLPEAHPEKVTFSANVPPLTPRPAESIPDVVQFCPHCGAHSEGEDLFCAHCGTALHAAQHRQEGHI